MAKSDVGHPGGEMPKSDAGVKASQRSSDTEMGSAAEGDVRVGIAVDAKVVGVVEHSGVAVGSGQAEHDDAALGDVVAIDGGVLGGNPFGHVDGTFVAE